MFNNSDFNQDILRWNVDNVNSMRSMFVGSVFNQSFALDSSGVEDFQDVLQYVIRAGFECMATQ
jgi:hypothetical protein